MIKSRRAVWVFYVVYLGELRNKYKILVGNLKGRDQSGELARNRKVTLNSILNKCGMRA
jgi:hypothetical protein